MFTIGTIASQFKLSRSTLLYYDKIGLLNPSGRSESNYRLYSNEDVERLRTIMRHRNAGIPLNDIAKLLDIETNNITDILTNRLKCIQAEIMTLKKQENIILAVLMDKVMTSNTKLFNRRSWTKLLEGMGFTEEECTKWHQNFEKDSPHEHVDFLRALGMSDEEISTFKLNLFK